MATIIFGNASSKVFFMMRLRSFRSSCVSVAKLARILSPFAKAPDISIETTMKIPPNSPGSKWAFSVPQKKIEQTTPTIDNTVPIPTYFMCIPPYSSIRSIVPFRFKIIPKCTYTNFLQFTTIVTIGGKMDDTTVCQLERTVY